MRRSKIAAEHTRQSILDAALVLFDEQGYAQTGINTIAQKIGATRGAVYGHFANKEAILAALVEDEFSRLHARNAAAIAGEHIWQDLADNIIAFLENMRSCPIRQRLFRIIHQQKQNSATLQALRQRHEAQWQAQCREAVARSKASGELLADADADYLFFHLTITISGLIEYNLCPMCPTHTDPHNIARVIRTTIHALTQAPYLAESSKQTNDKFSHK